ncbi:MAG: LPS export ABC transporter periplasmic protein LptC [Gammaproteobacteria bacterium]
MIARVVIVLVIVGIIIGALILGQGGTSSTVKTETGESSDVPGYSARNAEVTQTGDDGRPQFTVVSPLIRQHANDDRVQLDAPRMTFVSEENGTWHAQARSGLIQADGANVDLHGDVKMEGELSGSPVVINTSTMSFDTKAEIARTPAYITIDARGGTVNATGLVANLKEGTLELESNPHLESPIHARSPSK